MSFCDIELKRGTRVLITGGAGFIGSNIAEALLDKGCFVRVLDNFSTGSPNNIEAFVENAGFELIEGDIRDYDACRNACYGMDYVSHQAAWGSVPRSIEHPLLYCDINVKGTLNMLEAARQSGVKRFILASSSSVYGDSESLPKKEGCEGRPLSPYAVTKRVCEEYAALYHKLYGLNTIGLRYFNVFGRKQAPTGAYAAVIPRFIGRLIEGEAPVINGDGEQSRDFTYIDNVIEANMRAITSPNAVFGRAYNIAGGDRITLLTLYNIIANAVTERTGVVAKKPVFVDEREGDIRHSNADITDAVQYLGYAPRCSFDDGIRKTIDWYMDNLQRQRV